MKSRFGEKKMNLMKKQYFCVNGGFLNFLFFVWKAYLASIINKNPKILTKRTPVATTVPFGMNIIVEALVYQGIPLDLRFWPEQSCHLSGALLPQ